jgi:integrase
VFVKSNRDWLLLARIPYRGEHFDEYFGLKRSRDNLRQANKTRKALERAIRDGRFESEFRARFPESKNLVRFETATSEPTLGEFAQKWLDEKTNLTDSTRYDYNSLLKFHILPHSLASMCLSKIDDGDVSRFIGDLQAKTKPPKKKLDDKSEPKPGAQLSARRINMVIARLRSIFATAQWRKLIADNPMHHVKNLREPRHDADPFDLDEARRIIEAAHGWERAFVTTLLYTGMRPGEALALHWDAIDWNRGVILVRFTESRRYGRGLPKTPGSERDVDMIAPVRAALKEQRPRSQMRGALVFQSMARTAIDLANFRARNWLRMLSRAKIRPRTIYQCRHTFARLAIENGDTPQHVAAQLGHTSVEMVFRVYARWMQRPASALEKLERAITHPSPKTGGQLAGNDGN